MGKAGRPFHSLSGPLLPPRPNFLSRVMATILLIRHGETDWNRTGQIMGDHPVPLNQAGRHQAQRVATLLHSRSITALYCSPVERATETARYIGEAMGLPVTIARGLTEIGVGEWQGRFWKDLGDDPMRAQYYARPDEARPPGGETLREVQRRAIAVLDEVRNPRGPVAVVSHADVIRTIIAHFLGWSLTSLRHVRIDHASITGLEIHDSHAELTCVNYVAPEP